MLFLAPQVQICLNTCTGHNKEGPDISNAHVLRVNLPEINIYNIGSFGYQIYNALSK